MATIVTRAGKGSPLTNAEVDANFTNLNDELATALFGANNLSDLADVSTARSNLGLVIGTNVQAYDADLAAIAALSGTAGFLKTDGSGTWTVENFELTSSSIITALGATPVYTTTAQSIAGQKTFSDVAKLSSGATIGSGNAHIYESATNAVAIRTGASGSDKYTTFAADGSLTTAASIYAGSTMFSVAANSTMAVNDSSATLELRNVNAATGDAGMAMMRFHCQGTYGIKMGLRADGYFGLGGWSRAAWSWYSSPAGDMVAAGNVTAYSDERRKKNWRDLPSDFIEQLARVRHGIYDRTDEDVTQVGVGAQSLRPVLPWAVIEGIDGVLTVSYGNAALVAAVQLAQKVVELTAKIDVLEQKVTK